MSKRIIVILISALISLNSWAALNSFYCPQNHGYINIGMTQDQVLAACGPPQNKGQAKQPVMQKVPVTQLLFNNQGSSTAFYGVWSLPVGEEGGAQLEVDIINNKVASVRLNGTNTNAVSICGGVHIEVGDTIGHVYGACGNPSLVNNTFINQAIPSDKAPEIWVYQIDQYQQPFSLTFVNGQLQSID